MLITPRFSRKGGRKGLAYLTTASFLSCLCFSSGPERAFNSPFPLGLPTVFPALGLTVKSCPQTSWLCSCYLEGRLLNLGLLFSQSPRQLKTISAAPRGWAVAHCPFTRRSRSMRWPPRKGNTVVWKRFVVFPWSTCEMKHRSWCYFCIIWHIILSSCVSI